MTIGSNQQAYTDQFPSLQEKTLLVAPQTDRAAAASTGFQSLHFISYTPSKTQSVDASPEYGGTTDGLVDPGDPQFGDRQFSGTLNTRLCLNQIVFPLAYLLGAPTSTATANGHHRHIFNSGAARLPLATLRDYDSQTDREVMGAAFNGLQMAVTDTASVQTVDWTFSQKSQDFVTKAKPSGADVTDAPERLFIPASAFLAQVNGVDVGYLLDVNINYSPNVQSEKYVDAVNDVAGLFIGDPTISVSGRLRFADVAQLSAFGGNEAFDLTLIAQGPTPNSRISIRFPRLFAPDLNTEADGTRGVIPFQANGAKTGASGGDAAVSAMIVTVENQVETV